MQRHNRVELDHAYIFFRFLEKAVAPSSDINDDEVEEDADIKDKRDPGDHAGLRLAPAAELRQLFGGDVERHVVRGGYQRLERRGVVALDRAVDRLLDRAVGRLLEGGGDGRGDIPDDG